MRSLVLVAMVGACGGTDNPPIEAPIDAPDQQQPQPLVGCTAVTPHDLDALAADVVARLHASGTSATAAHVDADSFSVFATFSVGAPADPGAAALQQLVSLGGPFIAGELTIADAPDWNAVTNALIHVERVEVGGGAAAFAEPAFAMLLAKNPQTGTWNFNGMTVAASVTSATAADVAALTACMQTPPSATAVRAHTFTGHTFVGCRPSSNTYDYIPQPADSVTIAASPRWRALDADGSTWGSRVQWHVLYPTTVVIDPANLGLLPAHADCACGNEAGFQLELSSTELILNVRAGLGCVICHL
jgi:hypothetical protein